jgi:hypothetical protein
MASRIGQTRASPERSADALQPLEDFSGKSRKYLEGFDQVSLHLFEVDPEIIVHQDIPEASETLQLLVEIPGNNPLGMEAL